VQALLPSVLTLPTTSTIIAPTSLQGTLTLLRNRLFLFYFLSLAGCAPMAVQHSTEESHPQNKIAAPQQTAAIVPVSTMQQAQPAVVTESAKTISAANLAPNPSPFITTDFDPNKHDVWHRIRGGFGMRQQDSKQVARYEQWYASRPEYVERMTERGKRYLYFIVEEVEKRGMPMEIALLPMIESAFNPGAYSTARASGIWQFIPSTGKNFGMQQNWWYDGRRDVINATKGALDYLQKLHNQFGEWDLALAAYNCGENSVMRAQARNRKLHLPTNYASLKLPKETRGYVPKLMAVKNIVSYPESFGLTLTDVPNKPYFAVVNPSRHIDVELAATMAEISMEEFVALNPAHNRPVILKKEDEVLLLPVANIDIFHANLQRTNQPLVSWQAYPTKKGEDLDELASNYGITTDKLRAVNGIHRSIKTTTGQTLLVPLNGEQAENEFTAFNTNLPPTDNSLLNAVKHTVRKGDTMSSIARRYHVKLSSLQSWNRGVRILRPGQHILVAQRASQPQRVTKQARIIKTSASNKRPKHQISKT
jgi:membrane-bound lytic murein transglycosylase D